MSFITLLVLFCVFITSRSQVPLVKVSGTHYSTHFDIGKAFSGQIFSYIDNDPQLNKTLLPYYNDHRDEYEKWVANIKSILPWVYDEIMGMADGSGIDFHLIMLQQLRTEIFFMAEGTTEEDCTDIHVIHEENNFIGHNEDGKKINKDLAYFADVTIKDSKYSHDEHWVAYYYPGVVAGVAYGWNNHGITWSGNAVTPTYVNVGGITKMIMYRVVLGASSFKDIIDRIYEIEDRAFGLSINFGNINTLEQMTVEIAQENIGVFTIHSNYSHVNNYKILNIPYTVEPSSVHRQARIDEFNQPQTYNDICNILGDTKDPEYPLYRDNHLTTLTSALYDLKKKTVDIYSTNPKEGKISQSYSLLLD